MEDDAPGAPPQAAPQSMEGAGDEPKRILYEIPDEMSRDAAAERVEEAVQDEQPAQEVPEPGMAPASPPVEWGDKLRIEALHLEGEPISQLSTSRLMAYVAHTGSRAKGIEWINDTRCVLVFDTYGDALEGLQRIQLPRGQEMEVGDEPSAPAPSELTTLEAVEALPPATLHTLLAPRLAMAFPSALYSTLERQSLNELPAAEERLADARARMDGAGGAEPVPEIYRDMELEELERTAFTPDQRRVKQLRQSLWIRFALAQHDTKAPRSAQRSNWYRQHGRGAGKEVVPRLLQVGEHARGRRRRGRREELFASDRRYDDHDPYTQPRYDRYGSAHAWGDDDYTPRSLLDRIGGGDREASPPRLRSRSASPVGRGSDYDGDDGSSGGARTRIRGRGSVRAPRARLNGWDD